MPFSNKLLIALIFFLQALMIRLFLSTLNLNFNIIDLVSYVKKIKPIKIIENEMILKKKITDRLTHAAITTGLVLTKY